jgi:hypothetical protein
MSKRLLLKQILLRDATLSGDFCNLTIGCITINRASLLKVVPLGAKNLADYRSRCRRMDMWEFWPI